MKITIYGRESCPYCAKAKKLAQSLKESLSEPVEVIYHDMVQENVSREDVEKVMGFSITTVPQILINDEPIQGGYTGFDQYIRNEVANGNLRFK